MQILHFFGILKESFKIISTYRKVFTQITLAVILPLSFIFSAHLEISEYVLGEILHNEQSFYLSQGGGKFFLTLSDGMPSQWYNFCRFKIASLIYFLVLSHILSLTTICTMGCIYTPKEVSFKGVFGMILKVCKRVMVTFISTLFMRFAFNLFGLLLLGYILVMQGKTVVESAISFWILYFILLVMVSVVWHLASVVYVAEYAYGVEAKIIIKDMIMDKIRVVILIFGLPNICNIVIRIGFKNDVFSLSDPSFGVRLLYAMLWIIFLSSLLLFILVVHTVVYFVYKSYTLNSIEESSMTDHLVFYLGDYMYEKKIPV